MIIPVIMAGGVGSRLWPVSRESHPKQFISFEPNEASLFQQTLIRLSELDSIASPIVVCNLEHRFLVAEQLRQLDINDASIMLEPMGKNTAPAVAMAALEAINKGSDPSLLVLAADHLIENVAAFHEAIALGQREVQEGKLVTFGIVPQSPETGYGYIRRGAALGNVYCVDGFVEKPDRKTATSYLDSGEYYWNSGMFMFSASTYLRELEAFSPEILKVCQQAYAECKDQGDFLYIPEQIFSTCPSDSIDYAIMEKTKEAVVVPLDANWNDLGAWDALWEQGKRDEDGNVKTGDVLLHDVKGSFVHAESRLVSLVGVENAVVIETQDAVLVSSLDKAQDVKEIVSRLKLSGRSEASSHAVVKRPWGSYESLAEDTGFQVKRIIVNPGASLSLQMHYKRSEHWVVVRGVATVTCGEEISELTPNEYAYIPVESKHRLENKGDEPVILIEVQCGSYLGEDDIVRFEDIYGREGTSE